MCGTGACAGIQRTVCCPGNSLLCWMEVGFADAMLMYADCTEHWSLVSALCVMEDLEEADRLIV